METEHFDFTHTLRVRYSEVDMQGIAFNANYLAWFDVAVTEFFRAHIQPYGQFVAETGLDFHVARAEIDYHSPAQVDDELSIDQRAHFGGARVEWFFRMRVGEKLVASGKIFYACVDAKTRKVKRIPQEIAGRLGWNPG
ncbi:MAG: acyl-CoA thioesterase [Spirochaetota bacterium]